MQNIVDACVFNMSTNVPPNKPINRAKINLAKYVIESLDKIIAKESEPKKETYTKNELDLAYCTGVFNVVGIDGLHEELKRLNSIGKYPSDIIEEARKTNKNIPLDEFERIRETERQIKN